jgi:Predicted metal binding domain
VAETAQFTEPAVSEAKFEQEIEEFRQLGVEYRARGWFLVEAEFPRAMVVMAAPQLQPAPLVVGVRFDYTNYDASPPSVRLVNPFSGTPYSFDELPVQLHRANPQTEVVQLPGMPGPMQVQVAGPPLMQPDEPPFLCIAGVREYHAHPGHSGDAWELHRAQGAGRLVRLLEVMHRYGIEPIQSYGINVVHQVGGLQFGPPPP